MSLNNLEEQKQFLESESLTEERIKILIDSFIEFERKTADVYEEFFKKLYIYFGKVCITTEQNDAIKNLLEITNDELQHENIFRHISCIL